MASTQEPLNDDAGDLFIGIGRRSTLAILPHGHLIIEGELAAVHLPAMSSESRQRIHRDMVTACCRRGPFLPARLDIVPRSRQTLRRFMQANAPQLCLALERVDGYVEIAVEVAGGDALTSEPSGGVDALALRDRLQRIAAAMRIEAGLLESQSRATVCEGESPMLTMALLAPSVAAFTIADRLEKSLRALAHDCQTSVSGPWPPYSFSALA